MGRHTRRPPAAKQDRIWKEVLVCLALAGVVSATFVWFCARRGYTLYYGDAASHINIARRIVDSRTPGYRQLGTVWLPLPHALMAPLVRYDSLWRSGVGGAIPAAVFFVMGAGFLYAAVRRATGSRAGAVASTTALGLNPNLLYLQATPMTEPIFLGCLGAGVYFCVRFHATRQLRYALGAAVAVLGSTLTRYDGWFLIPFFALFFLLSRSAAGALVFAVVACLGPAYWLAHNHFLFGDALEFYRGPHSNLAIYARGRPHPAQGDAGLAFTYYRQAMTLVMGRPLVWLGAAGVLVVVVKRASWPLLLFLLPLPFYVLGLRSGGVSLHAPPLPYPDSYYNTRYALAVLPACAAGLGVLASLTPKSWLRAGAAATLMVVCLGGWALRPTVDTWICWREADANSRGRRSWTAQAADFFRREYRRGDGILTATGDVTAVYQSAGIPLRETLNDGNGRAFKDAVERPDLFLREKWVVAIAGDPISFNFVNPRRYAHVAERVAEFSADREPVIEIYRKTQ